MRASGTPFGAAIYVQGDPNGVVRGELGQVAVDAVTGDLYQNTNGAQVWVARSFGGGGSGSLSIASAAMPAALNVTTEGTIDWFAPGSTNTAGYDHRGGAGPTLPCKKDAPGWIVRDFVWATATMTTANFVTATPITVTSTSGDACHQGAINSQRGIGYWTASGTLIDWGFRMVVPAALASRVLRTYLTLWSCKMRVSARLMDGSAAPVFVDIDTGASTVAEKKVTITYNAESLSDVVVAGIVTANYGASPNMTMVAVTLGES